MTGRSYLVLDFDGVICDSIDECCLSSWIAYHELFLHAPPGEPPAALRPGFADLRPFIRTGEDFVLIQELLAHGETVTDQDGFDAALARAGEEKRRRFRQLFHEARSRLLAKDRAAWLALNRVYPHVKEALVRLRSFPRLSVLSTKRPEFIVEVLRAQGVELPGERILFSDAEPKLVSTERLRRESGCDRAFLVEDQIDHIRGNDNPRVEVRLATWGYVRKEWLAPPPAVPLVTPEGFGQLVSEMLAGQ